MSEDPVAFVVIGQGHQAIGGVISHVNPDDLAQDILPQEEENTTESFSETAK